MSKRPADIIISTPASKVRRRLNFDSPYVSRVAAPIVRVRFCVKSVYVLGKIWMDENIKYRSPDVPRGCEGPCKVQSFESRHDIQHIGKVMCVSDVTRGKPQDFGEVFNMFDNEPSTATKIWMDENIKTKNHTNSVMFFGGQYASKEQALVKKFIRVNNYVVYNQQEAGKYEHRDRYQVLRKWYATVTGGQYASKEQALVKKFIRVNNYVVYNQQEAGKYENHSENALMLYMACTHASNPVYATLKIRIYFYDSVTN
ncbi:coat protein [Spinach yellow vein Sikar virus]|uniref:Capsid protein n=1 Tax=Spinach yellow vein Sikar virus TaxID=1432565 RepID=V5SNH6_9GEMI|nr:coat protein [Spinach yellow vein Sikar virus]AHB52744.1 coat protein [Spinach yellow vein Sikar virus]